MLQNGCSNKQLEKWQKRAWSFGNVTCTQMMPKFLKNRIDEYLLYDHDFRHLLNSEVLYIAYTTKDYEMAAWLVADEDLVIYEIEGYKDCTEDEKFYEFYEITTREKFWENLNRSVPNFEENQI